MSTRSWARGSRSSPRSSLIGGASLGPEKALGAIGGGAGSLLAGRRGLSADGAKVNTLSGFAGAYGGLFSSTVIVVMLIMEAARPGGQRFTKALAGAIVASSVSFGIYFAIAGAAFVAVYQVPQFKFDVDWQPRRRGAGPACRGILVNTSGVHPGAVVVDKGTAGVRWPARGIGLVA